MAKKREVLLAALSNLEKPPIANHFLTNMPLLKKELNLQMILEYSSKPANTHNQQQVKP